MCIFKHSFHAMVVASFHPYSLYIKECIIYGALRHFTSWCETNVFFKVTLTKSGLQIPPEMMKCPSLQKKVMWCNETRVMDLVLARRPQWQAHTSRPDCSIPPLQLHTKLGYLHALDGRRFLARSTLYDAWGKANK